MGISCNVGGLSFPFRGPWIKYKLRFGWVMKFSLILYNRTFLVLFHTELYNGCSVSPNAYMEATWNVENSVKRGTVSLRGVRP